MLVITHYQDIVDEPALKVEPVMRVVIIRYIIIRGKAYSVLSAQHGYLSQELDKIIAAFDGQLLEVEVQTVGADFHDRCHKVGFQLSSLFGIRQKSRLIQIDAVFIGIIEVVGNNPDFDAFLMALCDIVGGAEIPERTLLIGKRYPRRCYDIDAESFIKRFAESIVASDARYLVESQIDSCIKPYSRVFGKSRCDWSYVRNRLCRSHTLILYVSDDRVGGLDLAPVLHSLYQFDRFTLFDFPEDGALDPASFAYLCISCDRTHFMGGSPLGIELDTAFINIDGESTEHLQIIRGDIETVVFP